AAPLAGRTGQTVMLEPYPQSKDFAADAEAAREIEWIRHFILGLRQIRSGLDIAPSKKVPVILENATAADVARCERHRPYLDRLAGIDSLTVLASGATAPIAAPAIVGEMTVLVPLAGLIDPKAEVERLTKRIAKVEDDLRKTAVKLGNENFVRNAPPAVV